MTLAPQPAAAVSSTASQDLSNPDTFKVQFDQLQTGFKIIALAVEENRANRNLLVDVKSLQASGVLEPHETYIAQRVIDLNISREIPPQLAYLTESRRLAIFQPVIFTPEPATTEVLESEFMRVMTYPDWVNDYIRMSDAAKLNGFSFVDVSYDPTFPGHVSVEYVGTENLVFDTRVKCIQQSRIVARIYEITLVDLFEMARDYGFDPAVVRELEEKIQQPEQNQSEIYTELNKIYHCFFKQGGKVYHKWYTKHLEKDLTAPKPFENGVFEQEQTIATPIAANPQMPTPEPVWKPVIETDYPFYVYLNRMTENARIADTVGRADTDFYLQEAACSLWSAFVNTCILASRTMWSPKDPNPDVGAAPKQLNMVVQQGKIWNNPMIAFHTPWPDAMLPKVLEQLANQNANDTNQVNFAANNRQDTRKTAKEIETSTDQQQLMNSVQVTLYSTALRKIFTASWRIVQSAALMGKITFAGGQMELISAKYNVIPAGSVDYIARQEQIQSMQTDLPLIGPTAAGPAFLEEYLTIKYPLIAPKLIAPLRQAQQQAAAQLQAIQQQNSALKTLLGAAVMDDDTGGLDPKWVPHQKELATLGVKVGGEGPAVPPQPAGPAQGQPPQAPSLS